MRQRLLCMPQSITMKVNAECLSGCFKPEANLRLADMVR
jgi:hypothetical protein